MSDPIECSGEAEHAHKGDRRLFIACGNRTPLLQSGPQPFNGLITNDKFCLSRTGRLTLNWWRYPLRRRADVSKGPGTVPDLERDRGGADEAPLASAPPDAAGGRRSTAVGPGIHAHPGLEPARPAAGAAGNGGHLPPRTGGEP